MASDPLLELRPSWEPAGPSPLRTTLGRLMTVPVYATIWPYALFSKCDLTPENCRWWRGAMTAIGVAGSAVCHSLVWWMWSSRSPLCVGSVLSHSVTFMAVGRLHFGMALIAHHLMDIIAVDRSENRLRAGRLHGRRVLVVGNGPSAVEGKPLGSLVDRFDEVIRFNNFQTKTAGLSEFVGTKTTVHFTDGVLYPTYEAYFVPGADVVMSLFTDRFMVAGSYVIMRAGADLQADVTLKFLKDPTTAWIEKSAIERLKSGLGLTGVKHPTSGMLAIDHFVNMPDVGLPVYIHGFDFFQGPKMHYYDDHEPLYERVNDRIGVNMHSPGKEKVYVEKLIAEGKVRFLRDHPDYLVA